VRGYGLGLRFSVFELRGWCVWFGVLGLVSQILVGLNVMVLGFGLNVTVLDFELNVTVLGFGSKVTDPERPPLSAKHHPPPPPPRRGGAWCGRGARPPPKTQAALRLSGRTAAKSPVSYGNTSN